MNGFFESAGFMAHGMCLLWREDLILLHVLSDSIIAIAYFSIPIALLAFIRKRPEMGHRGVIAMFAAFILLCGASHLVSIWTLWNPDYVMQGLVKAATAAVSLLTALALWPLLPKLLALPTPRELTLANKTLAAEVDQRRLAEQRHIELERDLEAQVAERTQQMEASIKALAESEHRFRGAFETAPFGMTLGRIDGHWTEVNQAFCSMLGYSEHELIEKNWTGITHADDLTDSNASVQKLLCGQIDSFSMEKRYIAKNGEIVYALTHVTLVRDQAGAPAYFMSQAQNVTDRVELETAVRESEARASEVLEAASDAILELDEEGRIVLANAAGCKLFALNSAQLENMPVCDLLTLEGGSGVVWKELVQSEDRATLSADTFGCEVRRKDGTVIPAELRLGRLEGLQGDRYSAIVRDVSERVEAERAVHEAHEALQFHMANSPLAVIEWDQSFSVRYWSPSAELMFGWRAEEVIGRNTGNWRIVHEDDEALVAHAIDELSTGRTIRNRIHNRNYRKDGSFIHTEWFNSVRTDSDGKVVSTLSFVEDITQRIEDAAALTSSEAHTKAVLDTAVDGIISIEPNGTVTAYNAAAERIFGYSAEEVVGRNVNMLMPAPYREQHGSYLDNFMRTGERKVIGIGREVIGMRKNGEQFPMELAVSEVRTEFQRSFTGFVRDISERKRFEQEIVDANRQLQEKEWFLSGHAKLTELLRGDPALDEIGRRVLPFLCKYLKAEVGASYLVDDSGDVMCVSGFNTVSEHAKSSLAMNMSGTALQAMSQQECVTIEGGSEPGALRLVTSHGEIELKQSVAFPVIFDNVVAATVELSTVGGFHEDWQEFLEFVNDAIAVAIASAGGRGKVEELLRESREQAVMLEEKGNELHAVNSDLRERSKSLEQKNRELEIAKEEIEAKARAVEQANKYKSEFLANMSHELRTPLNSMLVLSRSLAENRSRTLSADDIECADVIHSSGENLLALINDILDLSKVEAGKLDISLARVDLAETMRDLAQQFQPIADSRNLEFRVTPVAAPLYITTDPMRLLQILRNLLGNAFKFTDSGYVALRLQAAGPEHIEFQVEDSGIGIAPAEQGRIFDAFGQVDGTTRRRYEGTGLGLSISRELGRLLGAEISLDSQEGAGSTFTVRVPVTAAGCTDESATRDVPAPEGARGPARTSVSDQRLAGCRVLVVDDDYRNSFALSKLLSGCAAGVAIADSGQSGLEKMASERYDVVLMDIMMPVMNGFDTIRAIRERTEYDDIPIIAVTADVTPATREAALAAGACAVVSKPIDNGELVEMLADLRTQGPEKAPLSAISA